MKGKKAHECAMESHFCFQSLDVASCMLDVEIDILIFWKLLIMLDHLYWKF